MKLFYAPGACSLAPHIALIETGQDYSMEKVDLKTKTMSSGGSYLDINPKAYVPALLLDDGELLTEAQVILQYIADRAKTRALAPEAGSMARYHLMEWLNFVGTEIHKAYGPLFQPGWDEDGKNKAKAALRRRFAYIDEKLQGRDFLTGPVFTIADAYLFVNLSWAPHVGLELSDMPNLQAFAARVAARPAVRAAMEMEGLIKSNLKE